jgi:hypothetical protein
MTGVESQKGALRSDRCRIEYPFKGADHRTVLGERRKPCASTVASVPRNRSRPIVRKNAKRIVTFFGAS